MDQVVEQANEIRKEMRKSMTNIQNVQGAIPTSKLPAAQEAVLTDKLIHVDSSIKTALSKVGVEVSPQEIQTNSDKALVKFFNMLDQ